MTTAADRWRALVEKATKGPWIAKREFHIDGPGERGVCSTGGYATNQHDTYDESVANRDLIVAQRSVAEALVEWIAAEDEQEAFMEWMSYDARNRNSREEDRIHARRLAARRILFSACQAAVAPKE